jgi:CBS domain-containing protein
MSPRAAWRLESLGFTRVFDYVAGKQDWFAAGLPSEGKLAGRSKAGDLARRDVPTCGLAERVGEVRERARAAGWDVCVVVNDRRIVLGVLRGKAWERDPRIPAEQAMRSGPSTFRPNVPLEEIVGYLREHEMASAWITTSDGRLVGLMPREAAERALHEAHPAGAPASAEKG